MSVKIWESDQRFIRKESIWSSIWLNGGLYERFPHVGATINREVTVWVGRKLLLCYSVVSRHVGGEHLSILSMSLILLSLHWCGPELHYTHTLTYEHTHVGCMAKTQSPASWKTTTTTTRSTNVFPGLVLYFKSERLIHSNSIVSALLLSFPNSFPPIITLAYAFPFKTTLISRQDRGNEKRV